MQEKVEEYLCQVEQNLKDLPTSIKARIINLISQKIQLEMSSSKDIHQILKELGAPDQLAYHYRKDQGYKAFKPRKNSIVKWIAISFITSITLLFLTFAILIYKFTPVMEINEERITILGGLIDINAKSGKFKVFDQYTFVENKYSNVFEGNLSLEENHEEFVLNLKSGILKVKSSMTKEIIWDCSLEKAPDDQIVKITEDTVYLDLEPYRAANCDIEIPIDFKLNIEAKEGSITLIKPEFDSFINLEQGNIIFHPLAEIDYNFQVKVQNGIKSKFPKNMSTNAYEINLNLTNGSITYE